jgi:GMP synthase (glutamine-hydrolysing)
MRELRLWIVDPSLEQPETQGVAVVAGAWPGGVRVLRPALEAGSGPDGSSGYDLDAVVLLGSRASVLDGAPWQDALVDWLAPVVSGEVGVACLGVCFGHQLICSLAGARVEHARPDRAKVLGFESTRVSGSRLVRGARSIEVLASHREIVTAAPPGFTVTGEREHSPVDIVEHDRRPLFGVQFHPEAREEFVTRAGLDPGGLSAAVRTAGDAILRGFVLVATRHAERRRRAGG